jgi:hypothetical protein
LILGFQLSAFAREVSDRMNRIYRMQLFFILPSSFTGTDRHGCRLITNADQGLPLAPVAEEFNPVDHFLRAQGRP